MWQNPLPQGDQITAVDFVDSDTGWAVGGWLDAWAMAGHGVILQTRDGGLTWHPQYRGAHRLNDVCFIDAKVGWAVGDSRHRPQDHGRRQDVAGTAVTARRPTWPRSTSSTPTTAGPWRARGASAMPTPAHLPHRRRRGDLGDAARRERVSLRIDPSSTQSTS